MKIIKVARAAFGTLNVTCTNNITIPNVGSHGYVVLLLLNIYQRPLLFFSLLLHFK